MSDPTAYIPTETDTEEAIKLADAGRLEKKHNMSVAQTRRFTNPDNRKKLGEALKGRSVWNKGIPRTEETKRKVSETKKKNPYHPKFSKESLEKRSISLKKVIHTKEWNRKVSESLKGRVQPMPYKDTKIELAVQKALTNLGIEYKKNHIIKGLLLNTPYKHHRFDIVVLDKKILIEVQGCYFHFCRLCHKVIKCKSQVESIERDKVLREVLESSEWTLIELWEHDIKSDMTVEYLIKNKIPQLFGGKKNEK
jgi:G:T-mismatch repair DNA endonuclease (very short patch repair protein)